MKKLNKRNNKKGNLVASYGCDNWCAYCYQNGGSSGYYADCCSY